jgi:hypothetical protein
MLKAIKDLHDFKRGDKVRVLFGKQEIKRGVIWRTTETSCQVLDPTEYKVKGCPNIDIVMSDYHPDSTDWFPFYAPNAERFLNNRMEKGIQVLPAPNLSIERKKIGIRFSEVDNEFSDGKVKRSRQKRSKKTEEKN